MEYKIYKFDFTTGVHFGKRSLEDAEFTIGADTIFSAICHEYIKQDKKQLEDFVAKSKSGRIKISDAFPYIEDTYYLPKPMLKITAEKNQGDSTIKKAYKKLSYVPSEKLNAYLEGELDVEQEEHRLKKELGYKEIKVSASIRGEKETVPYRVGTYFFKPGSGLYMIVGYEEENDIWEIEDCLDALSFSGIGGKRNAGLGRYKLDFGRIPEDLMERFRMESGSVFMSLSGSLPQNEELERVLQGASYLLAKRSGFVSSSAYAGEQLRKRDLYVMQAGACFRLRFEGDIYDVSEGGKHPVYRYAKPFFMEVVS